MSESQEKESESKDQKNFNYGKDKAHYLAELEPALFKLIIDAKSIDDPVFEGIRQGYADVIKQQKEIDTSRLPDWMQSGRLEEAFNEKAQYPDREKDKGNEPER